jgi:3-phosphoglycerate kinase
MQEKLSIKDLDLQGKRALIRVDFNVPIENGQITDHTRIRASLPTIQYALDHGASVILMSHLGRPKEGPEPKLSLAPIAKKLSELLKKPVQMAPDCGGPEVQKLVDKMKPGDIILLENLRFHKEEEKPSAESSFASSLAKLGDLYIDDAFGCAHRAHASITKVPEFFPEQSAYGFLMEKEIAFLGSALAQPKRPFYAILGGAKISTKFNVIKALMQKADVLMIGGAMAYTFFKSKGIPIGNSLHETEFVKQAQEILNSKGSCRILLPVDIVITKKVDPNAEFKVVDIEKGIPDGYEGVDIGPKTVKMYSEELKKAATVFWNGPLGVFECPPFAKGTQAIAKVIAGLQATTIVGGGDSVAAVEQAGLVDKMTHISTGGGASLEFIELGTLPGIEVLTDKKELIKK